MRGRQTDREDTGVLHWSASSEFGLRGKDRRRAPPAAQRATAGESESDVVAHSDADLDGVIDRFRVGSC